MSDLVERVARIIANAMGDNYSDAFKNKDRWIAKRGMSGGRFRDVNEPMQCDYLAAAQAAIAAMQTDAAPTLKPAVEVWEDAYRAWDDAPTNPNRIGDADRAAAAVIEADRAAIITAKDAEIAALKNTWQKQFDEKVRERGEAKLWFEKAQEWKQSLAALQAHADALAGALETVKQCEASGFWGADAEKHARAAWRGAFRKVTKALSAYEEFRR